MALLDWPILIVHLATPIGVGLSRFWHSVCAGTSEADHNGDLLWWPVRSRPTSGYSALFAQDRLVFTNALAGVALACQQLHTDIECTVATDSGRAMVCVCICCLINCGAHSCTRSNGHLVEQDDGDDVTSLSFINVYSCTCLLNLLLACLLG